jgi:hypothetical protein
MGFVQNAIFDEDKELAVCEIDQTNDEVRDKAK